MLAVQALQGISRLIKTLPCSGAGCLRGSHTLKTAPNPVPAASPSEPGGHTATLVALLQQPLQKERLRWALAFTGQLWRGSRLELDSGLGAAGLGVRPGELDTP